MTFEWVDGNGIMIDQSILQYSIFSCSVIKWKDGWTASIALKGMRFGSGDPLQHLTDFASKEEARESVEKTIVMFCKQITQAAQEGEIK